MITVTLYSKPGCHLCEAVKENLAELQDQIPHHLVEINIESDDAVLKAYFDKIPVVHIGPYKKSAPITSKDLEVTMRAAQDREKHYEKIEKARNKKKKVSSSGISKIDKFFYWLTRNYIWVLNFLVLLYVGLPFLAPVFMKVGWEPPARTIYWAYRNVCHQWAFRSWFLFGEQPVYPRASAGLTDLLTLTQATGIGETSLNSDLDTARAFVGSEQVGYKVALCQRDVATYGAILLFGILFGLVGGRIPGLPWYAWIALGILPIGLDGFSQVLSQPPLSLFSYRESTPLLRTITGGLFGFMTAWFGYPILEETMRDARRYMTARFAKAEKNIPRKVEKQG